MRSDTPVSDRVLVTGGSGFIGGRLVRRLIEQGVSVSCLVRAKSRSDELHSNGARLFPGDVTERGAIDHALAESQAGTVFHLAGLVTARHRADFMRVNAGGVENVAAGCALLAAPPVLIVVSSLAAAEPCAPGRVRVEDDAPAPASSYGRSKLAGERAAAKHAATVPITIVRPPIVFGPGDRAVLGVFRPIARWGIHFVPGWHGGERRVSLVHVDDLVEGLLLAAAKGERMQVRGPAGRGVYFMAGEDCPTYNDLGRAIAVAVGRGAPAVVRVPGSILRLLGLVGDMVSLFRGRAGWINSDKVTEALAAGSWTCSSEKARKQLGWRPAASLANRLRETAEWYRERQWL